MSIQTAKENRNNKLPWKRLSPWIMISRGKSRIGRSKTPQRSSLCKLWTFLRARSKTRSKKRPSSRITAKKSRTPPKSTIWALTLSRRQYLLPKSIFLGLLRRSAPWTTKGWQIRRWNWEEAPKVRLDPNLRPLRLLRDRAQKCTNLARGAKWLCQNKKHVAWTSSKDSKRGVSPAWRTQEMNKTFIKLPRKKDNKCLSAKPCSSPRLRSNSPTSTQTQRRSKLWYPNLIALSCAKITFWIHSQAFWILLQMRPFLRDQCPTQPTLSTTKPNKAQTLPTWPWTNCVALRTPCFSR